MVGTEGSPVCDRQPSRGPHVTPITIGRATLVTNGTLLKTVQVPESHEDYIDIDDPEAVIARLRTMTPVPDVFTFWQRLPNTAPRYRYFMEWDNVAALRVTSFHDWFQNSVHSSVRTSVRKSQKSGVVVDVIDFDDNLVEGLSRIFNETPIRQRRPYSHYGKSHDEVRTEWGADLDISAFIGAFYRNELIGFVKLTYTDRYAEMSGTICKLAHREKAPMNALIARSVQFCESRAIPYLTYGKYVYGRKGEDALSRFKGYSGFKKIELPRYYVPLTWRGRAGLRLGLHRRLTDRFPGPLLDRLIDLRGQYYHWRLAPGGSDRDSTSGRRRLK